MFWRKKKRIETGKLRGWFYQLVFDQDLSGSWQWTLYAGKTQHLTEKHRIGIYAKKRIAVAKIFDLYVEDVKRST